MANVKVSAILLGVALVLPSLAAQAQLYISPIVRHSITYNKSEAGDASGHVISGRSKHHGKFMMADTDPSLAAVNSSEAAGKTERKVPEVLRYGKNVPLFAAIDNVVPHASSWFVHFDKGIADDTVSWHGGKSWQGVLRNIAEQNHLIIAVNKKERAIGISFSRRIATYLAHPVSEVWRVKSGESMVANIRRWAKRVNLQVDKTGLGIDYPINHGAVITGTFRQALTSFLSAFKHAKVPVASKIYWGNNVVRLFRGGYQNEAQ